MNSLTEEAVGAEREAAYDDESVTVDRGATAVAVARTLAPQKQSKLEFISYDAVKSYLKSRFDADYIKKGCNPLLEIPQGWLEMLVAEAVEQSIKRDDTWPGTNNLSITIDGIYIPINYNTFVAAGKIEELKLCHQRAIDKLLENFDNAWSFICNSRQSFANHGGWQRVKHWWDEIISRAFIQNPFTPIKKLELTHNGKTSKIPYHHVIINSSEEDKTKINGAYQKALQEYLEQSFDHVLEYIFGEHLFEWQLIPEKYHREFCYRAFLQTPFTSIYHLKLTHNGKTCPTPIAHYQKTNRLKEFSQLGAEILCDYLDSPEKIIEYVNSKNFNVLGGWKRVPEVLRRKIIILATKQCGKVAQKKLNYSSHIGSINLSGLRRYYDKNGLLHLFEKYVSQASERPAISGKKSASSNESAKEQIKLQRRKWEQAPEHDQSKIRTLIQQAQNGNKKATAELVGKFSSTIHQKARQYVNPSSNIYEELIADGIETTLICIEKFDLNNGSAKFNTYLAKALERRFIIMNAIYKRQVSPAQAKNTGKNFRDFLKANPAVDFRIQTPQEIAAMTGLSLRLAIKTRDDLFKKVPRSLSTSLGPNSDADLESQLGREEPNPEAIYLTSSTSKDTTEIVREIVEELDVRQRIIVKQCNGLNNVRVITPTELCEVAKKTGLQITDIIECVEKFQKAISYKHNPEETMNGEGKLGQLLIGEVPEKLMPILMRGLDEMSPTETIILTSIFNLPPRSDIKQRELGVFFGLTGTRIGQIYSAQISSTLREIASNTLGIEDISEFLTPAPPVSRWDYLVA